MEVEGCPGRRRTDELSSVRFELTIPPPFLPTTTHTSKAMLGSLLDTIISFFTRLFLAVLASGPIPKHVAFVMDGNRRFARLRNRHVVEGHEQGFESLKNVRPTSAWRLELVRVRLLS